MADLLTTNELALWTQKDPVAVADDPFATEVIDKVSRLAQFLGGHDEWVLDAGEDKVPFDVQLVVLQVAKRCYGNPDQVVQEGGVGPIGGDRVLDAAALLYALTDAERAMLVKYNTEGDPDGSDELWVMKTTRGDEIEMLAARLYVGDDQQINLSTSPDPREWKIPLFNPGDPGDPNLYGT